MVIYALEDIRPYRELAQHLLRLMERGLMVGVVSTIVEAEVLVKPLRTGDWPTQEKAELFFRVAPNLAVRSVDRSVARRAALVRSSSRLPLPDAIIIATALEEQCEALVGNNSALARHSLGLPYLYLENYIS